MGKLNFIIEFIQEKEYKVFLDGVFVGNNFFIHSDKGLEVFIEKVDYLKHLSIEDLLFNGVIFKSWDITDDSFLKKEVFKIQVETDKLFFEGFEDFGDKTRVVFENKESCYVLTEFDLVQWDFQFPFNTFIDKLEENCNKNKYLENFKKESITDDFIFKVMIALNMNMTSKLGQVKAIFDFLLENYGRELDNTLSNLPYKSHQNNLANTFTFPPEIQSSCEQYLIYFATFLKDIGIHAETNVESKAHETLFTVIPKDGEEALDRIKKALQVYLKLPESPEFETIASEFSDVGVQQLVSQVHFLKSQLALGKTMIQMKDATIEALQLTNFQQKEIIQSHQNTKENEEELAGGLIKANEVKGPGFTINLPELLRRIKRKFT